MTHPAEEGGWKYYQLPRSEFYEELGTVLRDLADFIADDLAGAQKLQEDPYNDWFYGGYGGEEQAFRISLWPAHLPDYESFQEGEIDEAEFRRRCWPLSGPSPVTVYLGNGDAVTEVAEDDAQVQNLADSMAEFAGIELVDDWEDVPPEAAANPPREEFPA